jgi:fatty-acyl-CoA synthase
MSPTNPLDRLRRAFDLARTGAKVFRTTGLQKTLRPTVALKLARDARKGRKGALAIIHLHALSDSLRPAVVCGEQRYNYGELEERVNRMSHGLRQLGMGPGERIGAFLHNSSEYVELNAALAAVGGVSVQIGYRLKAAEVAYMLENSGARAMVFHADLAPVVEEALGLVKPEKGARIGRERCIAVGAARGFTSYEALLHASGVDPSEPATVDGGGFGGVMVYTSGTTGHAKGATRNLGSMGYETVLHFMSEFPITRDERHLVVCPQYHSMAAAFSMMVMGVGGCLVIAPHFEPEDALRAIERERITSTVMVPTMLGRILQLPLETIRKYDTSSLRWMMSGAAPLPTELARRAEDVFGPILYNFYGATETGFVTIAKPGEHTARPGTIGRKVGGNEIRLLDSEGRDVPDGQVGEIYARNSMLMEGYYRNAEATRAASRDGYISVGDLAWRDQDGYYYLADRKTDMVISGGVNIYPWEIEQRLHEHPAVADVAVVGVPDAEWGESLAAFVVLRRGSKTTAEELQEFVKQALADYKRPRRIYFVDALPRNPTGKILKRELKQRALEQAAS